MRRADVTFRFVTPALLAGADQKSAEIRAASIRGALRWWMNALNFDKEAINDLFGSAAGNRGQRSRVIVRDTTPNTPPVKLQTAQDITGSRSDYFLWPFEKKARGVIPAGFTASFSVIIRSGKNSEDSPDLENVLKAFLLLGSLGTRSRRCYGSVWPKHVEIDGVPWKIPATEDELKRELSCIFDEYANMKIGAFRGKFLDYKTAVKCCIDFLKIYRAGSTKSGEDPSEWGKNDHDAGLQKRACVCRPVLGLPLVQNYSKVPPVSSSITGYNRLASPVHFKVIPLKDGFVPIVFFCYNMIPPDGTEVLLTPKGRRPFKLPLQGSKLIKKMQSDKRLNTLGDFLSSAEEE